MVALDSAGSGTGSIREVLAAFAGAVEATDRVFLPVCEQRDVDTVDATFGLDEEAVCDGFGAAGLLAHAESLVSSEPEPSGSELSNSLSPNITDTTTILPTADHASPVTKWGTARCVPSGGGCLRGRRLRQTVRHG
ncbi:hypothetical protein GCM10009764_47750 [Nocardia ninae]|uniref:Uncharacterized protein n=1 Tax=Nocardia ninae NBRC 108245 TaxID=1210091 RepID=A0A511MCJ7_9NOCA|nr:hypothetical protein NN4_28380 [Nocardia ninae NBRC 108245]